MPDLPSGTVTFLFTDIEGSTRLYGPASHAARSGAGQLVRDTDHVGRNALLGPAIVDGDLPSGRDTVLNERGGQTPLFRDGGEVHIPHDVAAADGMFPRTADRVGYS